MTGKDQGVLTPQTRQELALLGWTAAEDDVLVRQPELVAVGGDQQVGRVARVDRGECDVRTVDGVQRALSSSHISQRDAVPATGDWVVLANDHELGTVIEHIFERRTSLVRRDAAEQVQEQVLVANIDIVGVVHGLDQELNDGRLERLLVLAADSGAEPAVFLTKADQVDNAAAQSTRKAVERLAPGAPVIVTASLEGRGLDEVQALIADRGTAVLLGPSGVGKSTLTNAVLGFEVQETTEVRERDGKGRHTTTNRELFVLPGGGVLIDTPGIRAVGLWSDDASLDLVYADVAEAADHCRFRDCGHASEPGCGVQAAIAEGTLDPARLARFTSLRAEIAERNEKVEEQRRRQGEGRRPSRRRRR